MSEKILQSRYKQLLSFLDNLDAAVSQLYSQGLVTLAEKEESSRKLTRIDKEMFLCDCLTGKGASGLVNISQVLKNEQMRQCAQQSAAKAARPVMEVERVAERSPLREGEDVKKAQLRHHHSQEDAGLSDGRSWDSRVSSSNGPVKAPFTSDKLHLVEDTFSVLFYTFLTQLLHYFNSSSQSPPPMPASHDEIMPKAVPTRPPPPGWLKVDLMIDSTRDYFSPRALKDIVPSERSPVALKLSLLLESFQQFYHTHKSFKSKNLSLHEKLLDSVKAKEKLEADLSRLGRSRYLPEFQVSKATCSEGLRKELEETRAEVEALRRSYIRSEQRCKQLVVVTQQWALECDEKVRLIEVQEAELKGLRTDIEQLERRVTKYKKFWMEYRKGEGEGQEGSGARATDLQYEELRNELAFRRELYDMVMKERDEAQKEVTALFTELEALKDHNVQLADRAANYQVQAKAKEPAVREMSSLLEQNRKLKAELEQVAKEKAELQDRVKALEVQIDDFRNTSIDGKKQPTGHDLLPAHVNSHAQQQQPRKGQVLITGRNSSPAKSHGAPVFSDVSNLQCPPPQKKHRHYHNQPLVSQDPSRLMANPNYSQITEDDTCSLASSEGGGDSGSFYSSHSSTTTSRSGLTSSMSQGGALVSGSSRSRPGSAPPPPSQFGSRDASDVASGGNWTSGNLESADFPSSETSFEEGGDYTRAIRYPNHSKIHVAPLVDEDRLVLRSEHPGGPAVKSPSRGSSSDELLLNQGYGLERSRTKSPVVFEQNGRRQDSVNGDASNNVAALLKRTCPTCNLVFHSLSDAEFEGHRRSCRGNSISI